MSTDQRPTVIVGCHAWFGEQFGGSFKIATEHARSLVELGYRVCYVCSTREKNPLEQPGIIDGVEVWAYPAPVAKSPSVRNLYQHISRTARLAKAALADSSQVAFVSGHSPLQFLGVAQAARLANAPTIFHIHSPFWLETLTHQKAVKTGVRKRLSSWVAKEIDRRCLQRCNIAQCDSRYTAGVMEDVYGRRYADKLRVSPGWVDMQRFQPAEDRGALRRRLGQDWESDVPTFLTVRRLEPRMGIDVLIRAAALLAKQSVDFRVLIGGDGSLRSELERLVADLEMRDRVRFLGRISENDLPLTYAAADCFVLPTRALECFGLIILEAYASNTPVIASAVGAIPELAGLQGEEWLVPPDCEQSLAETMRRFVSGEVSRQHDLRSLAGGYDEPTGLSRLNDLCLQTRSPHAEARR